MKVAVTGATGFIGRHVLSELSTRAGLEVVATSRGGGDSLQLLPSVRYVRLDIGAESTRDAYNQLGRPDIVIHLAWAGLPNYRSLHHFESELPKQYAFLLSLIEEGLPSLFVSGTCYEYGMRCGELHESLTPRPTNPYAYAKNALREQLEFRRSVSKFDLTWARLFYTYGDGQAPTSLYSQLVAAIERRDATFKMSGGEQLRDYLRVEEVARLIVDLAIRRSGAGVVNICSGRPTSVRSLVEQWVSEQRSSISLDLGQFPYPDYEPMAFWGSVGKLEALLDKAASSATH